MENRTMIRTIHALRSLGFVVAALVLALAPAFVGGDRHAQAATSGYGGTCWWYTQRYCTTATESCAQSPPCGIQEVVFPFNRCFESQLGLEGCSSAMIVCYAWLQCVPDDEGGCKVQQGYQGTMELRSETPTGGICANG
jgi:hypothetical protein